MALTFRPSQWFSLGLPSESSVSLELRLSIYGIFRGCVLYKYSPRPQIALQTMGMDGIYHPPSLQMWVVREYNSMDLSN